MGIQDHQSQSKNHDLTKTPRSSQWVMWCILLVCVLPVALSSLIWWMGWGPRAKTQGGVLVQPIISVSKCFSPSMDWSTTFQRKWSLVVVHPRLKEDFREYLAGQLRTMQGKERERVVRVSIVSASWLAPQMDGLAHWKVSGEWCPAAFSKEVQWIPEEHRLYVVDPLGNIVMVFDDRITPKLLHKDLTRLLSVSQIG
jgi:hypothetical protein